MDRRGSQTQLLFDQRNHGDVNITSPELLNSRSLPKSAGLVRYWIQITITASLLFIMIASLQHHIENPVTKTQYADRSDHIKVNIVTHQPEQNDQIDIAQELVITPTIETWENKNAFYTSTFGIEDTSSTIIFNVYKGSPEALQIQLHAAIRQRHVVTPEIWVMCFNSPMQDAFEQIVSSFKTQFSGIKISFTTSGYNYKFHGRFLLAYMATTKYVLLVDDDKNLDDVTIFTYIMYMKKQPGLWGNFGHIRSRKFDGYKAWPKVGFPLIKGTKQTPIEDYVEVDYLSGMWFLQQTWLEYFVKERIPTWNTSEDMHLSHVMRKYLNLNSYGGKIALEVEDLPVKTHAATRGSALILRENVFDHQLGRGNKVSNVVQPINSLVYVETVADIDRFIRLIASCEKIKHKGLNVAPHLRNKNRSTPLPEWCNVGPAAAIFRGAVDQDVQSLVTAADRLCEETKCLYTSVKPPIVHPIRYFNMREGFGQQSTEVEIPLQTSASDVLLSFVGVLNNVEPENIFIPIVTHTASSSMKTRIEIYYETIKLGAHIYRNSQPNQKWHNRHEIQKPKLFRVYEWSETLAQDDIYAEVDDDIAADLSNFAINEL